MELRVLAESGGSKIYFLRERPRLLVADPDFIADTFGQSLRTAERESMGGYHAPFTEIMTTEDFVKKVQGIEEENKGASPKEIMQMVNQYAMGRGVNLHVIDPATGALIDIKHFIGAGGVDKLWPVPGDLIGLGVEFGQLVPGMPGWWQSALNPLDLFSNALGVEFFRYFLSSDFMDSNSEGPLFSEELAGYLLYRQILGRSVVIDSGRLQNLDTYVKD